LREKATAAPQKVGIRKTSNPRPPPQHTTVTITITITITITTTAAAPARPLPAQRHSAAKLLYCTRKVHVLRGFVERSGHRFLELSLHKVSNSQFRILQDGGA
jgi:hypothetical protein